jgi:hypothetical protein
MKPPQPAIIAGKQSPRRNNENSQNARYSNVNKSFAQVPSRSFDLIASHKYSGQNTSTQDL